MKTYLSPGLESLKPPENNQMLITVAGVECNSLGTSAIILCVMAGFR